MLSFAHIHSRAQIQSIQHIMLNYNTRTLAQAGGQALTTLIVCTRRRQQRQRQRHRQWAARSNGNTRPRVHTCHTRLSLLALRPLACSLCLAVCPACAPFFVPQHAHAHRTRPLMCAGIACTRAFAGAAPVTVGTKRVHAVESARACSECDPTHVWQIL